MEIRRRTKIITTIGPATMTDVMLQRLIQAGVDVIRLNFSHASNEFQRIVNTTRDLAAKAQREVAILADLQGPKIRIGAFKTSPIHLNAGDRFVLDTSLGAKDGTSERVGIDYKALPEDVVIGNKLLLDDGRIVLIVKQVESSKIICDVMAGGPLSNNKGINLAGGGLSAPTLTDKDKADLKTAISLGVDYIGLSFIKKAEDVNQVRALLKRANSRAHIITKIERAEALEHLDAIILTSDAVMVARGDLGVEIGDEKLPGVQKHIIHRARMLNRAVITATQMMESMVNNPSPTRAEVFDVSNAVLDGTDAVMLSAESAIGQYPDKAVEAMARICLGAEQLKIAQVSTHRIERHFETVDEAIAMATMYTANHLKVKAIITLTESGKTPLWMSRIRSGIPIFALCRHQSTRRAMALYRGVYPIPFDVTKQTRTKLNTNAVHELESRGFVHAGDAVILTKGDYLGVEGGSNTMKIIKVGHVA